MSNDIAADTDVALEVAAPSRTGAARELANLLLAARRMGVSVPRVHDTLVPPDAAAAYAVQDLTATLMRPASGPVRGWKVGAPAPVAEPACAPLHEGTIFEGVTALEDGMCRFFGVEAELVYKIGRDLPERTQPWTEADLRSAITSVHAAIEILDTRFERPGTQAPLVHLADQGNHGALIIGTGVEDWASLRPVSERVQMTIDGKTRFDHLGGNSAGDPMRMLVWLANHAAARGMPLCAGDVVTTGSTTGTEYVSAGVLVDVVFPSVGRATVQIP